MTKLTGETKTEAILRALRERAERLALGMAGEPHESRLRRFLSSEVWPQIPDDVQGKRLSRDEEDALLGYGQDFRKTDIDLA